MLYFYFEIWGKEREASFSVFSDMAGVCAWLAGVCVLGVLSVSADTSLEAGDHAHPDHQHTPLVSTSKAASGREYSRAVCFPTFRIHQSQNSNFLPSEIIILLFQISEWVRILFFLFT